MPELADIFRRYGTEYITRFGDNMLPSGYSSQVGHAFHLKSATDSSDSGHLVGA